ncbi:MAG: cell division protein ZapA [Lachnospiraceae bacterium]|mgnify:FL=1|nr:cell division protein ZapA [Lachnospiraceae bacterium]
MASKNTVQVLIDGKIYTLSGYENADYLNKVAAYINNKLAELKADEGFRHQNKESQATMVYLNIADDYFKSKKQADILEAELENKNKELYNLKHEIIGLQIKEEAAGKELADLQRKYSDQEKQIIKLETELSAASRRNSQHME